MRASDFDERYDFYYDGSQPAKRVRRGKESRHFQWPRGWRKLALSVEGLYRGGDRWLDRDNGWSVAFHGTVGDRQAIKDIVRSGFKVKGGKSKARNGQLFGAGVYVSPDPEAAAGYAELEALETLDGERWYVVFQVRVRPGCYTKRWHDRDQAYCWVVPDEDDVRPCGIMLRRA